MCRKDTSIFSWSVPEYCIPVTPISLSPSARELLLDIYLISERKPSEPDFIDVSDINGRWSSPTSLNRTILRLEELGFIDYQRYRGVRLTEAGQQAALYWLRRLRIAEVFLKDVMGFAWDEIPDEAGRLIGGMNELFTQRMFDLASAPQISPYGEPIPDAAGRMREIHDQPIWRAPLKTALVITRIATRDRDRLKYIDALQLVPGTALQVIHVAPFEGPLQLALTGEYRIIGHSLAEIIFVRLPAQT